MNSQDPPAKDAPLTVNEQVTLTCLFRHDEQPSLPAVTTLSYFVFFAAVCSRHPPCANIPYHKGVH